MPPQFPVPVGTAPPPTPEDPNLGQSPPAASELPPFDPRAIPPSDTSGWTRHESLCYGYSLLIPAGWTQMTAFTNAGYQQGEDAAYTKNGAKLSIGIHYTTVDQIERAQIPSRSNDVYVLEPAQPIALGLEAVRSYLYTDVPGPAVIVNHLIRIRPDWYVAISLYLPSPYNAEAAAEAAAVVDSLSVQ